MFVAHAQLGCQCLDEAQRIGTGVMRGTPFIDEKRRVAPHRLSIGAPVDVERPARQLFARVPLALAEVQESALPIFGAQLVHQFGGKTSFGWSQGVNVPLWCIPVIDRHKGGLTAHRQAHVARFQFIVHGLAQRHDIGPLLLGIGLGHAR